METPIQQKLQQAVPMQVSFEPEQFNEIELDEQEIEEALRIGREVKYYALQREAYRRKLQEDVVYTKHSAEQLFDQYAKMFKIQDDKHRAKIVNLCCYFANDSRSAYDLNKGLLLMGSVGNGKTTIFKLFSANQNHSFRVVSMLDISFDYKTSGEPGVKPYGVNYTIAPNTYGKVSSGYCFDDVGTEEVPCRHFGESKNIFSEVIQIRYNNKHLVPFNSTHVTTNKNEKDLRELYGERTYDRLKEMFNVVVFEHDSFRG